RLGAGRRYAGGGWPRAEPAPERIDSLELKRGRARRSVARPRTEAGLSCSWRDGVPFASEWIDGGYAANGSMAVSRERPNGIAGATRHNGASSSTPTSEMRPDRKQ